MLIIAWIILVALIGLLIYQDAKSRTISVLPLTLIALINVNIHFNLFQSIEWMILGTNLLFLILLFGGTWLYFTLVKKAGKSFWTNYLGLGDLLFMVALIPLFTTVHFILFTNIALILALIVQQFVSAKTIPLVSYLGGVCLIFNAGIWLL